MELYSVCVVTRESNPKAIAQALAPYHEFEVTGRVDEYVQSIDVMELCQRGHANRPRDDSDPREPLSLADYLGKIGIARIDGHAEPDLIGEHRRGWFRVIDGEVVESIQRTNPQKRWAGYRVGGHFKGMLLANVPSITEPVDSAPRRLLDLKAMQRRNVEQRTKDLDQIFDRAVLMSGLSKDALIEIDRRAALAFQEECLSFQRLYPDRKAEDFWVWVFTQPPGHPLRDAQTVVLDGLPPTLWEGIRGGMGMKVPFTEPNAYGWAQKAPSLDCWAFLDIDGAWHEEHPGGGRCTCHHATWEEAFAEHLAAVDPDHFITIVECRVF